MELKIMEINNRLLISFTSPDKKEFFDMLKKIKSLQGRKYEKIIKKWEIPKIESNLKKLKEWGFNINYKEKEKVENNIKHLLDEKLFPFQKDGVQFIHNKKGRGLIADEMGVGKTIQALAYLKLHKNDRPVIIVCPATLKLNWQKEIKKWLKESSFIANGRKGIIPIRSNIVIINFDIIQDYIEKIKKLKPKIIIIDESHYIKSHKTLRYKGIKKITKDIKKIIAMTGTPILNKPIEIWTTLSILRPDLFFSRFRFANRYCDPKHNGFAMTYNGATNIEELHSILIKEIMIRRLKKDVLKDLPDKIISILPLEIDNRHEYEYANNEFTMWLLEKEKKIVKVEALTKLEKLKQLVVEGKMIQITKWINNVIINNNEKLVVICTHHKTIDTLIEKFKDVAVKLDGRDSLNKKQLAVDKFQNDKSIKLFIGNIKAAGVGITLTRASILAFIELDWTPGIHNQAMDRIHRIGQAECCNIYYIIGKETIEEDIMNLLDSKKKVVDSLIDGKITESEDLLSELLNKYYKGV
jgi:SNF2 family DNA or RNA helicase